MQHKYDFTLAEWEICLKVLQALKDSPLENPDNQKFGALITKIHKNAKKALKPTPNHQDKVEDIQALLQTTIAQNAISGKSAFHSNIPVQDTSFTLLKKQRNCYCCHKGYTQTHFFYGRLCPTCAKQNYENRFKETSLIGKFAIVTGGRVKVGYATALRFLRNGATVVITTRFPALALENLQNEEDFEIWKDKVYVYGLDLRNLNAIENFTHFYAATFGKLDILVNNAAQTIKYPDEYYAPILQKEQQLLPIFQQNPIFTANNTPISQDLNTLSWTDLPIETLPLNRFGQPIDFREKTSWNSTLTEIDLYELLEVNLINQIAPYQLIKSLKPLFLASDFKERFIINVTSSEGIFSYQNKTKFHPHTNMTKAALNMLTLTSAQEFVQDQIYMSCVDVGWISTGATETLRKKQFDEGYIPPLDPVDGASRIFHPIIEGIQGNFLFGVLIKDYQVVPW